MIKLNLLLKWLLGSNLSQTWISFIKWIKIVGFWRLVSLTVFQSSLFLFVTFFYFDTLLNPVSPNSDNHQFSFNNIHTLSREIVTRINQMITKEKMLWSVIKPSQLISKEMYEYQCGEFGCGYCVLRRIDNASPICHFGCGKEPWLSLLFQRLLGLLLEMRWPAIGQFFPCLQWQSQKSFQKLTWNGLLLISNVDNWYPLQVYLNRYLKSPHGMRNMPG